MSPRWYVTVEMINVLYSMSMLLLNINQYILTNQIAEFSSSETGWWGRIGEREHLLLLASAWRWMSLCSLLLFSMDIWGRILSEAGVIDAGSHSHAALRWTETVCWWKCFTEHTEVISCLTCTCTVLSVGLEECCHSSAPLLGFAHQTARIACTPAHRPRSSSHTL